MDCVCYCYCGHGKNVNHPESDSEAHKKAKEEREIDKKQEAALRTKVTRAESIRCEMNQVAKQSLHKNNWLKYTHHSRHHCMKEVSVHQTRYLTDMLMKVVLTSGECVVTEVNCLEKTSLLNRLSLEEGKDALCSKCFLKSKSIDKEHERTHVMETNWSTFPFLWSYCDLKQGNDSCNCICTCEKGKDLDLNDKYVCYTVCGNECREANRFLMSHTPIPSIRRCSEIDFEPPFSIFRIEMTHNVYTRVMKEEMKRMKSTVTRAQEISYNGYREEREFLNINTSEYANILQRDMFDRANSSYTTSRCETVSLHMMLKKACVYSHVRTINMGTKKDILLWETPLTSNMLHKMFGLCQSCDDMLDKSDVYDIDTLWEGVNVRDVAGLSFEEKEKSPVNILPPSRRRGTYVGQVGHFYPPGCFVPNNEGNSKNRISTQMTRQTKEKSNSPHSNAMTTSAHVVSHPSMGDFFHQTVGKSCVNSATIEFSSPVPSGGSATTTSTQGSTGYTAATAQPVCVQACGGWGVSATSTRTAPYIKKTTCEREKRIRSNYRSVRPRPVTKSILSRPSSAAGPTMSSFLPVSPVLVIHNQSKELMSMSDYVKRPKMSDSCSQTHNVCNHIENNNCTSSSVCTGASTSVDVSHVGRTAKLDVGCQTFVTGNNADRYKVYPYVTWNKYKNKENRCIVYDMYIGKAHDCLL